MRASGGWYSDRVGRIVSVGAAATWRRLSAIGIARTPRSPLELAQEKEARFGPIPLNGPGRDAELPRDAGHQLVVSGRDRDLRM